MDVGVVRRGEARSLRNCGWRGQVRDRVAWGGEGGKGIGYGEVREVWLVDEVCKRGLA